jgi:hypothetical protein
MMSQRISSWSGTQEHIWLTAQLTGTYSAFSSASWKATQKETASAGVLNAKIKLQAKAVWHQMPSELESTRGSCPPGHKQGCTAGKQHPGMFLVPSFDKPITVTQGCATWVYGIATAHLSPSVALQAHAATTEAGCGHIQQSYIFSIASSLGLLNEMGSKGSRLF